MRWILQQWSFSLGDICPHSTRHHNDWHPCWCTQLTSQAIKHYRVYYLSWTCFHTPQLWTFLVKVETS